MNKYAALKDCSVYINPGSFDTYGGWSLDTQFFHTVRSEYLLAHGIGIPVSDAEVSAVLPSKGKYRIWVRTKNWTEYWIKGNAPGVFRLLINGEVFGDILGTNGKEWMWQEVGIFDSDKEKINLSLHDLTGFEGRCAGIFITSNMDFIPPDDTDELTEMINAINDNPPEEVPIIYDLVVCSGGIAGMCTAISAARNGLKTALIQDRSILGGNNSSEVRVWLGGETNFEPYPNIGNIVKELEQEISHGYGHKNTAEIYEDEKKLSIIQNEENIDPYISSIVSGADVRDGKITSLTIYRVKDGSKTIIKGKLFSDSTGDGDAAYYSGADYEVTVNGHMGMTNMWNVRDTGKPASFPDCSAWAIDLADKPFPGRGDTKSIYGQSREMALGGWYWESGMEKDPILFAEYSRDLNLRAMYSAWHTLKNIDHDYENYIINHSSFIGGKRESRRFLGDVILTKCDVHKKYTFPDACVPATWDFDVHCPDSRFYATFTEGAGFLSRDCHEKFDRPYFIPYRCLYSRNIENLFLAGRNISVTHDALGSVRVMRTGGMMGEVIGKAAYVCIKHSCDPRGVYQEHLSELIELMKA